MVRPGLASSKGSTELFRTLTSHVVIASGGVCLPDFVRTVTVDDDRDHLVSVMIVTVVDIFRVKGTQIYKGVLNYLCEEALKGNRRPVERRITPVHSLWGSEGFENSQKEVLELGLVAGSLWSDFLRVLFLSGIAVHRRPRIKDSRFKIFLGPRKRSLLGQIPVVWSDY